jgi:hypothetical protein
VQVQEAGDHQRGDEDVLDGADGRQSSHADKRAFEQEHPGKKHEQ